MQTIIAALLSLFILDPLQAAIGKQLSALGIPRENAEKIATCARTAMPTIAARIGNDPVWGLTQAIRFWTGAAKPDAILVEIAPQCAGVLDSARRTQGQQT